MEFGYIPAATGLLANEEALQGEMGEYFSCLNNLGGYRLKPHETDDIHPLLYFLISGGTEKIILNLREQRSKSFPDEPVLLLAHPDFNSLPASLEVLARLRQEGIPGRIFFLKDSADKKTLGQLTDALAGLKVKQELKNARIGMIGAPSDWLVASSPDSKTVSETWGPEIINISFGQLKDRILNVKNSGAALYNSSLKENAFEIVEPSQPEIEDAEKVYAAFKKLVDDYKLSSITVRCFDLVTDMKMTGCFGLSQLSDDGIIAGCEGDLCSTIGMLWAYRLLGEIPWMANPARLDEKENTLCIAHCTVPRKLLTGYSLRSHFESGLGLGIQGTLPSGPVTLLRIGGRKLEEIWLSEGSIINTGKSESLCRTQAEIKLSSGGNVSDLLYAPLGNHLVMVPGRHMQRLKEWWETFIEPKSIKQ